MAMKEYKTTKTEQELLQDLRDGKKVKAVDIMSAMGIKVIMCE